MDEIAALRAEIAELRHQAESADATIAFVLGMLIAKSPGVPIDMKPEGLLAAALNPGWTSTIVAQISAGREVIRSASRF